MTTVVVIAVIIIALVLVTLTVAAYAATNKRNEEGAKQAILQTKARTDCFQYYITDNLSSTSRVRRTPRKQALVKREEPSSAYYEVPAYEAPTFGYVDNYPGYNYSDGNTSSSSGSSSHD